MTSLNSVHFVSWDMAALSRWRGRPLWQCLLLCACAAGLLFSTATFAVDTSMARKGRRKRSREGPAISVENQAKLRGLQNLPEKSDEALAIAREVIENPGSLTRVKEVQSFMSAFGRLHFWRETLELLELKRTGEWPVGDIVLTNAALSACSQVGNWELVLELLADAPKHAVSPDIISYNLAMGACCNAGKWETVLSLMDDLQKVKGRKDFATFNVTLHACTQGRQWQRGIFLLDEMMALELQPTWTMYNLGILMAGEGQLWQSSLQYLRDMWTQVVLPDAMTYASVISVCAGAQQWQQATQQLTAMKRKGFAVPPETLQLVEACRPGASEG